ncbi:glycoside hydrolase family 1 protein [Phaffia rhodozyma]|uniref:Glycoside hydrolase family 1 protein n=1 Tax=Phaffia rhodozyma TaxID=264483 RepID=A0A0F7SLY3_PHARH|nr:glycoside hydrolase family 1 protein [Phaffia rhodozyma]
MTVPTSVLLVNGNGLNGNNAENHTSNGHSNGHGHGHSSSNSNGPADPAGLLPDSFLFGFASASAQIESAAEEGERGPSIWDKFCTQPGKIQDGTSVARTCDHVRLFKEDIALMKSLGVNSYRFSFSWSRIIPKGGKDDPVSEEGIQFYSDLIDELLENGITPFATLYHWDLPLALYERYGGWLSRDIFSDFERYADLCFSRFGDRVKHWLTLNEPWCVAVLGHGRGAFAPGHVSNVEPWIVGHHCILAHAKVTRLYRTKYKSAQKGTIGITLNGDWAIPLDNRPETIKATQDKMDVAIGWFADPIYLGHYPPSLVKRLGDRLPKFTEDEIKLVHGSSDFYGCNTYTTNTIVAGGCDEFDGNAILSFQRPDGSGRELGVQSEADWLQDVPWGLRALLNYLYKRYKLPIFMTENGFAVKGEHKMEKEQA